MSFSAWAAPSPSLVADAAAKGDAATLRTLIQQKADVNGAQPDGATALQWAAYKNDLAMADLAGEAERWLGIPVIAINVATYWSALRANGIDDRIRGFGSLLAEH